MSYLLPYLELLGDVIETPCERVQSHHLALETMSHQQNISSKIPNN